MTTATDPAVTPRTSSPGQSRPQAETSPSSAIYLAYAVTIFTSAFLLFQVQPLISKFILPWFGGSPAVWTTAMLFFQVALCAGYGYAHLSTRFLSARGQLYVHLFLLTAAVTVALITHITPTDAMKPKGNGDPMTQILILLATTVGLPYLVLSSTGPLLQKWYSDAFHGASPYRLFALSNVGSLLALLSYPFLFEIAFDSREQAMYWSFAFAVFFIGCAYCAWYTFNAIRGHASQQDAKSAPAKPEASPGIGLWTTWILLPALASVMFLAVTNEVCQNVATVPLLWIIPLSLYLISFIVAFDSPRWYSRTFFCIACLVLMSAIALWGTWTEWLSDVLNAVNGFGEDDPRRYRLWTDWVLQCAVYFGGLFAVCMVCHCEMANLKPSPKYLTAYFMTMSIGGAIGGLLVNLLCPYIFTTFFELPLTMVAAVVTPALFLLVDASRRLAGRPASNEPGFTKAPPRAAAGLTLPLVQGVSAIVLAPAALLFIAYTQMIGWEGNNPSEDKGTVYRARNFYGLVSVQHRSRFQDKPGDGLNPDENFAFISGHIKHGRQYARPEFRHRTDIAYWGPNTGCQLSMAHVTQRPDCRIGIVGLGIGTIAGFAKEGHYVRAYEINPEVVDIAENNKWFTYLQDARDRGVKVDVVLGDARLELERELEKDGSNQFDVLCMDAFSGDAVPTHLLTDEAFALYKKHLKPNGIIVVNITNTYLNLFPVVRTLAKKHDFKYTRVYNKGDSDKLLYRTYFALLTNDEEFLAKTPEQITDMDAGDRHARFKKDFEAPLWTDRYSNLFQVLQ
jgi:hypothetical protein